MEKKQWIEVLESVEARGSESEIEDIDEIRYRVFGPDTLIDTHLYSGTNTCSDSDMSEEFNDQNDEHSDSEIFM